MTKSQLDKAKDAIKFAQEIPPYPIHSIKNLKDKLDLSARTIRRRLVHLDELGLIRYRRGYFMLKNEVISQPHTVLQELIPSLIALKRARRFGKYYRPADVNYMRKHLPRGAIITLDYKAHELTKFQTPLNLYVYVDDVQKTAIFLKNNGFWEGEKGNVIILPKIGSFKNMIERVFLDCVANGGRGILDAAAIMLTHKDHINSKVRFTMDTILKVQADMPKEAEKTI